MADLVHTRRRRRGGLAALAVSLLAAIGLAPTPAAAEASADLSVAIEHAPGTPLAGDEVSVTVRATNDGPDPAVGTVIAVDLLYELQVVSGDEGCSQSQATGALICALGDLASGSTVERVIVVRPYASGLYTLTAAVASSTPDPDSADRTATDSLIVQKGPSQAERYLTAIYPILLDRPIDPTSLAFWGPRWQQASFTYPQRLETVPLGIIRSSEHRRNRVRAGFAQILGRSVDPAGLRYWTDKLGTGFTTEQFERTLLLSPEFARKHPGEAFLPATVEAVLGAAPSEAELADWADRTRSARDRRAVALVVQRSTEAYDVLIAAAYQDVFGEAPTALERWSWQVGLRNGETRETMASDLLVSWRFLADFPRTIDDYPPEEFARAPMAPDAVLAEAEAAAAG